MLSSGTFASLSLSSFPFPKPLHDKELKSMERQKSFIIKPTNLFFFSFTITSSLLFFFLFSFWVLNTTPSSASSNETHLQFSSGFSAIKAQSFLGLASNFSVNGSKDSILGVTHYAQATDSPTQSLGLGNELKGEILGDAQVETSGESYEEALDLVGLRKDDILNHTHLRRTSDLMGESKSAMSEKLEANILVSNESSHSDYGDLEKIEKNNNCDITDGRWVFDESYPLYTNSTCPFIDEGFSCEANGRLDRDYMKWRWQPRQCNIPRFDPVKMLELVRGKRLVFVGDSINRNQWESMLCLLRSAVSDPSRVYEARGRRITKERGNYNFKFVDYQCSIEYHLSHFLVHESKARVGQKRVKTLRIDTVDRGSSRWKGADILVFNTAHWWSHYKTKSGLNYYQEGDQVHPRLDVSIAFKRALTAWASWVDRYINPRKTQVYFRSSAPSHFSGGEWNAGGHCKESARPLNDTRIRTVPEKNLILEEVVKQMKTPVTILNITNLSGLRIDGHPSIYGRKSAKGSPSNVQDCSHWCLPGVPDAWNEMLYFYLLSGQGSISTN